MTKNEKKIVNLLMLVGGGMVAYSIYKKRADQTKANQEFMAIVDGGSSDLISEEDYQTVNIQNGNLSVEEWLAKSKV